jgi:hypothetical protein
LRQVSYQGQREDKPVRLVVRAMLHLLSGRTAWLLAQEPINGT